jgi:ferredoxin
VHDNGKLIGIKFEKVKAVYDSNGKRSLIPTGEAHVLFECDDVLVAVGQENSFPWIERDVGVDFGKWDMPVVDEVTYQSSNPQVFFGGDAAFGPKNVITAVAHGHQVAISIDLHCRGEDVRKRPAPGVTLVSQKMGVHEWSYDSKIEDDKRYKVPHTEVKLSLSDRKLEVELGFDVETAIKEAQRCLNCDIQTAFTASRCIECDACADICPTECISFVDNAEETELRKRLRAPATNLAQDLYVSTELPTTRVLVKDEDVCLHCGLCAERCPTSAWDMQKFLYQVSKAGQVQ